MSLTKLANVLRPRLGRFVPREPHPEWVSPEWTFAHNGVEARVIASDDGAARREAKDYMRRVFYREAPIPMALGLADGPPQVQEFLEGEMDTHLDSGGCMNFREEANGGLVGVGFFCLWARDEHYEVVDADATAWHNAAAALARERAPEVDSRVTWRDLQYQHLYNLSQKVLRRHPDKDGVVWAAMLSFVREARERGLSEFLITNFIRRSADSAVLLGAQSNFPGFDKFVLKNFSNPSLEDQAKYADEQLEVDGKKVLQTLSQLGGMKFFVNVP